MLVATYDEFIAGARDIIVVLLRLPNEWSEPDARDGDYFSERVGFFSGCQPSTHRSRGRYNGVKKGDFGD